MAKISRGERTRDDILQTAKRLFSLNGYFHTSTSDILEAVSLSKGAFYHHFNSKEELALAVLDRLRLDYIDEVIQPVQACDPGQRPRELLKRILQLNRSGQWFNCLLLIRLIQETAQLEGDFSRAVRELTRWLIDFWTQVLRDAQTAGAISDTYPPHRLAELIFSALIGAISCCEHEDIIVDTRHIAELIDRGFFQPVPSPSP